MLIAADGAVGSLTCKPYPSHMSLRKETWTERLKQGSGSRYGLSLGHKQWSSKAHKKHIIYSIA